MIEPNEFQQLAEIVGDIIKESVSRAKEELRSEFEAKLREHQSATKSLHEEFKLRLNVAPSAISPADVRDLILPVITDELESAVNATREKWAQLLSRHLPKPEPVIDLSGIVREEVSRQVKELPPPEPGKDADPVDTAAVIAEVVKQIPPPIHGKDADEDAIVQRVLSQIRQPEDGKNADMDAVFQRIDERVSSIPKPEPVDKAAIIAEIQSQIRIPEDGKSIDLKDVEAMVQRAIEALPKPKDGVSVHPDTVRVMVLDEVRKAVSELPKAKDGDHGRDALAIEILPAIDPSKEYPRGTFAKDKNGLWRREATGWECIVSGIQGFDIVQSEDLRSFVFTVRSSDGSTIEKQFSIPVMIYRYLHDKEQSYKVGDTVTYDGNIWHSNVDDPTTLPGTSKEWTLAVRAGRPGRDLRPEEPKQHTPVQLGNGKKK